MIDVIFLIVTTALAMALVALITSFDHPARRRAIELSPFGLPWLGLYDGLDVPEHVRRRVEPGDEGEEPPLAPPADTSPYR